jgi:hypothetical protein
MYEMQYAGLNSRASAMFRLKSQSAVRVGEKCNRLRIVVSVSPFLNFAFTKPQMSAHLGVYFQLYSADDDLYAIRFSDEIVIVSE